MSVSTLEDFINSNPPARELKRALAVQMSQQGYTYREIRDVLQVSVGFVSHCNQRYAQLGIAGLKLNYWGTKGYLSDLQKQELFTWLDQQDHWTLDEIAHYVNETYGVSYKSLQSYYSLLQEAGFSWKKHETGHPDKDEEQVALKKKEISELLVKWRKEIASGQVRVLFLDECHLLWGDVRGYGGTGALMKQALIPLHREHFSD